MTKLKGFDYHQAMVTLRPAVAARLDRQAESVSPRETAAGTATLFDLDHHHAEDSS